MTLRSSSEWGRSGSGRGRVAIRLVLALWAALCVVSLAGAPASAHASLISTDPAEGAVIAESPESVSLRFNENVSLADSATILYDATGAEVATESRSTDAVVSVAPTATLTDGTYVLTYRVVSADGHPIAGSLSFSVGAPSETVVTRTDQGTDPGVFWIHGVVQGGAYLALFLAAGLAIFLVLVLPSDLTIEAQRLRLGRFVRWASAVAVLFALLLVPLEILYQQGLDLTGLSTSAPWTGWASGDGLLALLVVLGLGVAILALPSGPPSRGDRWLVLAGSAVALGALAVVGHTRSYGPTWLVVAADVSHVVSGAIWFGGLVGLVVCLRALADRETDAATILARFSTIAGVALAVVAIAGIILGWRIVGSWAGLVNTAYGLILLTKAGAVALIAVVAAWNRYRLLPAIRRDADGDGGRRAAHRRLRTSVMFEAAGLVAVLMLTGFLVNQVPREESAAATNQTAEPAMVMAEADGVHVMAHVEPARVGDNTVTIHLETPEGEPLTPFSEPQISLSSESTDLGSRPVEDLGGGMWETEVLIPSPGAWQIQVSVRLDEFTNPVLSLDFDVVP